LAICAATAARSRRSFRGPYQTFGFGQNIPFVGLLRALAVLGPFSILISPALAALQRRFERQADDAVLSLTVLTAPFGEALKRLARDNLANLHPHPLYARFYYAHPPLAERIERLAGNGGGQKRLDFHRLMAHLFLREESGEECNHAHL